MPPTPITPPEERFRPKWKVSTEHEYNGTPCWEWTANKVHNGYGRFYYDGQNVYAHRLAWEWEHSDGLLESSDEIDHLCRVRHCVNPEHLQRVPEGFNGRQGNQTRVAQQRAKTHCPHGHPYSETNTWLDKKGRRYCRTCLRVHGRTAQRTYLARKRKEALEA